MRAHGEIEMITIRTNPGTQNYMWVDVRDVNREDVTTLTEEYSLPAELLADILDFDEQSRIEKEDDYTAIIMRIPQDIEGESPLVQNSIPLGVIIYPDRILTICQSDSIVLEDFAKARFRQYPVGTKEGFVISILGRSALVFIRILKYINRQKDNIEERLTESMDSKELSKLLDIQKSLVYLSTSVTSNQLLLEKMVKPTIFKLNSEDESDFLDDVLIDNRQAITMANNYQAILTATMDTFSQIIGNNTNRTMKKLTILSVGLMFPTFITGYFGMNVELPGQGAKLMWLVLAVVCVLVTFLGSWLCSDEHSLLQRIKGGKERKKRK